MFQLTKKVFLFNIILSVLLLCLYLSAKSVAKFDLNSNTKTIILGHSHSECSLNDSLLSNTKNLSQSGESYFYTYIKTKAIVDQNPQIENVIIEFSNNQICKEMDNWIWDDKHLSYRLPMYNIFMTFDETFLLFKNNPKSFIMCVKKCVRTCMEYLISSNNLSKIGGYMKLSHKMTSSEKMNQIQISSSQDYSETNILYLEKIIKKCSSKNICVYFIRSPLHKNYPKEQNEFKFQTLLKTKFSNVRFIDGTQITLEDNNFADLEHLNQFGATNFTKWFHIEFQKINTQRKKPFVTLKK